MALAKGRAKLVRGPATLARGRTTSCHDPRGHCTLTFSIEVHRHRGWAASVAASAGRDASGEAGLTMSHKTTQGDVNLDFELTVLSFSPSRPFGGGGARKNIRNVFEIPKRILEICC